MDAQAARLRVQQGGRHGGKAHCCVPGAACLIGLLFSIPLARTAFGSTLKLCVREREGSSRRTPKRGKCKRGDTLTSFGKERKEGKQGATGPAGPTGPAGKTGSEGKAGRTATLAPREESANRAQRRTGPEGKPVCRLHYGELNAQGILPYIKFVSSGIDSKPTVQFSGVNVQVVNGEDDTAPRMARVTLSSGTTKHRAYRLGRTTWCSEAIRNIRAGALS